MLERTTSHFIYFVRTCIDPIRPNWMVRQHQSKEWNLRKRKGGHGARHARGCVLSANEALDIINRPSRVGGCLIFGGITDEALCISEGDVRRSDTVTLIIGDDLDLSVLVDTDTRVPVEILSPEHDINFRISKIIRK